MSAPKLTEEQRDCLHYIDARGPFVPTSWSFANIEELVRIGLIDCSADRGWARLTDAGRAELKEGGK